MVYGGNLWKKQLLVQLIIHCMFSSARYERANRHIKWTDLFLREGGEFIVKWAVFSSLKRLDYSYSNELIFNQMCW